MKHSKNKKPTAQPQPPLASPSSGTKKRWAFLGVGLILAAGATWGVLEFVVWNRLPRELVGKWEVVQGPPEYKEAVFEFFRSGKLVARVNDNGQLGIMKADIRVEGDKIYATTYRPSTGKEHVSIQTIRTLTEQELVVADERGKVMKMIRMR